MAKLRNERVGFVFQSFNLLPRTTVLDNVILPLFYSNTKTGLEKKAREALEAVGLGDRTHHLSNQISGGQKQRVAIARALICDPKVIFADEPTGNLDSKSGQTVMEIIQKLNKEHGHTIILITHETYTAEYADRIISLKDGKVESDGKVENHRKIGDGLIK